MREGALPSPANQARVIQDVLAMAERDKYRVNVIEAFDQPWKRELEGTVGGHWGLIADGMRQPKFVWGEAVSNHPRWPWQAAGGVVFAALVFAAAFAAGGGKAGLSRWLAVGANALAGGILIGWTIENVPIESLGTGGWLRSLALTAVAVASPFALSAAIMRGTPLPRLSRIVGPAERSRDPLTLIAGIIVIATLLLAILVALGLVFNRATRISPSRR